MQVGWNRNKFTASLTMAGWKICAMRSSIMCIPRHVVRVIGLDGGKRGR